jgi:hypothetical protein
MLDTSVAGINYLCMVFGQLTNRDSLRDLIVAINAHEGKSYHLGFGKSVTRSNLAKANERRDSRIFEEFAYHLVSIARKQRENDDFKIKGQVYAFDSTTIDLCLSVFWWAKFRKKKVESNLTLCLTLPPRSLHLCILPQLLLMT